MHRGKNVESTGPKVLRLGPDLRCKVLRLGPDIRCKGVRLGHGSICKGVRWDLVQDVRESGGT